MSKGKRFYQITTNERTADINIYGDITSYEWFDSDKSAHSIKSEIDALNVDTINVYINSYGGEVAEALAIYTSLKRHSASIHTFVDGFACSAATIIFCAGDVRTMGSIALMMIHNCMSYLGYANSEEMRKAAEDNDKINQSSIEAYKKVSNLSEDAIKEMMNVETWLTAQECLEYGFATELADDEDDKEAQQSAFQSIREAVLSKQDRAISVKLDRILDFIRDFSQKNDEEDDEEENTDNNSDDEPEEEPDNDNDESDDKDEDEKTKETFNQKAARLFGSLK